MMFIGIDNENMKYINTFVKYLVPGTQHFLFVNYWQKHLIIINVNLIIWKIEFSICEYNFIIYD